MSTNTHLVAWRERNPGKDADSTRRYAVKLKDEVIAAYGNKCSCCGEVERSFLCLDHVNGGGRADRAAGSLVPYRRAKKLGYPPEFRVLCHNCNHAVRFGSCPHKVQLSHVDSAETQLESQ